MSFGSVIEILGPPSLAFGDSTIDIEELIASERARPKKFTLYWDYMAWTKYAIEFEDDVVTKQYVKQGR